MLLPVSKALLDALGVVSSEETELTEPALFGVGGLFDVSCANSLDSGGWASPAHSPLSGCSDWTSSRDLTICNARHIVAIDCFIRHGLVSENCRTHELISSMNLIFVRDRFLSHTNEEYHLQFAVVDSPHENEMDFQARSGPSVSAIKKTLFETHKENINIAYVFSKQALAAAIPRTQFCQLCIGSYWRDAFFSLLSEKKNEKQMRLARETREHQAMSFSRFHTSIWPSRRREEKSRRWKI